MIEEKAYVVAKTGAYAWVEAERRTSCDGCAVSKGCGTGTLARYLAGKPVRIRVSNWIGAEIGDEVIVGIPESTLLQGSVMIYLLPLLALFLGTGLGEVLARYWGGGESLAIGLGFGGLAVGFLVARCMAGWLPVERNFEPKILASASKGVIKIQPIPFVE